MWSVFVSIFYVCSCSYCFTSGLAVRIAERKADVNFLCLSGGSVVPALLLKPSNFAPRFHPTADGRRWL